MTDTDYLLLYCLFSYPVNYISLLIVIPLIPDKDPEWKWGALLFWFFSPLTVILFLPAAVIIVLHRICDWLKDRMF